MPKIYRYTIRDGVGTRWLLEIWDSGNIEEQGEYKDVVWAYRVTNETASVTFSDFYTGQHDSLPHVSQLLRDFVNHFVAVAMCFAADARDVTGDPLALIRVMPEVCRNYGITEEEK
jgi:hypothetical protein